MEIQKTNKHAKTQTVKAILIKNNVTGGINQPDFRICYKVTVIKTLWYWHRQKYRPMEEYRKSRDKSMHLRTPYL